MMRRFICMMLAGLIVTLADVAAAGRDDNVEIEVPALDTLKAICAHALVNKEIDPDEMASIQYVFDTRLVFAIGAISSHLHQSADSGDAGHSEYHQFKSALERFPGLKIFEAGISGDTVDGLIEAARELGIDVTQMANVNSQSILTLIGQIEVNVPWGNSDFEENSLSCRICSENETALRGLENAPMQGKFLNRDGGEGYPKDYLVLGSQKTWNRAELLAKLFVLPCPGTSEDALEKNIISALVWGIAGPEGASSLQSFRLTIAPYGLPFEEVIKCVKEAAAEHPEGFIQLHEGAPPSDEIGIFLPMHHEQQAHKEVFGCGGFQVEYTTKKRSFVSDKGFGVKAVGLLEAFRGNDDDDLFSSLPDKSCFVNWPHDIYLTPVPEGEDEEASEEDRPFSTPLQKMPIIKVSVTGMDPNPENSDLYSLGKIQHLLEK